MIKVALLCMATLCRVGCNYEGYDDGKYINKQCACINYFEPEDLSTKKTLKPAPFKGKNWVPKAEEENKFSYWK